MLKTQNEPAFAAAVVAIMTLLMAPSPVLSQSEGDTATAAGELDEIVVTGIRASLLDAINKKKNADDIRDLINAEDVGKLPDKNVAEALQRVTGIQIGRDFGEGQEISVRGLSQNRIELDGQTQVGTGASRSVGTFSSLPAEMFSSLEVIKTPAADEVEGSLGAIIRLNTRRPLSHKKLAGWASLESRYADRSGKSTPRGSLYVAKPWFLESGDFGASINITHHERRPRQDFLKLKGWRAENGHGEDLDGNGIADEALVENDTGQITALNDAAFRPLQTALAANLQDRQDNSLKTAFQWISATGSEWNLDLNYSKSERKDNRYQYTASINGRQMADRGNTPGDFTDITFTDNQTAIAASIGALRGNGNLVRGMGLNFQASRAPYKGTTKSFALNNERQITDALTAKVQLAGSWGNQFQDQLYSTFVTPWAELPRLEYDFGSGTDIPNIIMYQRTGDLIDDNRLDFMSYAQHKLNGVSYQKQYERNSDKSLKVDFDYETDLSTFFGDVDLIEFGLRSAIRTGERNRNRIQDSGSTNDDGVLGGMSMANVDEVLCPQGYWDINTSSCGNSRIIAMPHTDLLDGASGDYPTAYLTLDGAWMMGMGDEMMVAGGSSPIPEQDWGFNTEEKTNAVYVKANFVGVLNGGMLNGVSYQGNFGLRYIETSQYAFAYENQDGASQPRETDTTYSNLLPSLNLSFGLVEDELLLRLGLGKKMARARMQDIVPQTTLYSFTQSGKTGNPNLKPEEVNAFDLSLEHYTDDGGILSAAMFHYEKTNAIQDDFTPLCVIYDDSDITGSEVRDGGLECGDRPLFQANVEAVKLNDGIEVPITMASNYIFYNLATKLNVEAATVKGIEVAYQKTSFDLPYPWNGMGFTVNYTLTKTDTAQKTRTGYEIGLQDFSENSYNVVAFYENDGFEGRIAYNYRDAYYDEMTQANAASISKPYGQLDASLTYNFTPKWSLGVSVTNIFNDPEEYYQEIEERQLEYTLNDSMWNLTLRGQL